MLKLKLQYFGHLMLRANSLEKTLMLGKTEEGSSPWESQMGSLTSFLHFFLAKLPGLWNLSSPTRD